MSLGATMLTAAATSAATSAVGQFAATGEVEWGSVLKSAVIGAVTAGFANATGLDTLGTVKNLDGTVEVVNWGARLAANGVTSAFNGLVADMTGGDFSQTFVSSFFGKLGGDIGNTLSLQVDSMPDLSPLERASARVVAQAVGKAFSLAASPNDPDYGTAVDFLSSIGLNIDREIRATAPTSPVGSFRPSDNYGGDPGVPASQTAAGGAVSGGYGDVDGIDFQSAPPPVVVTPTPVSFRPSDNYGGDSVDQTVPVSQTAANDTAEVGYSDDALYWFNPPASAKDPFSGGFSEADYWNSPAPSIATQYVDTYGDQLTDVDFVRNNGEYVHTNNEPVPAGTLRVDKSAPAIPDGLLPQGVSSSSVFGFRDQAGNLYYAIDGSNTIYEAARFTGAAQNILSQGTQGLQSGSITPSQYLDASRFVNAFGDNLPATPFRVEINLGLRDNLPPAPPFTVEINGTSDLSRELWRYGLGLVDRPHGDDFVGPLTPQQALVQSRLDRVYSAEDAALLANLRDSEGRAFFPPLGEIAAASPHELAVAMVGAALADINAGRSTAEAMERLAAAAGFAAQSPQAWASAIQRFGAQLAALAARIPSPPSLLLPLFLLVAPGNYGPAKQEVDDISEGQRLVRNQAMSQGDLQERKANGEWVTTHYGVNLGDIIMGRITPLSDEERARLQLPPKPIPTVQPPPVLINPRPDPADQPSPLFPGQPIDQPPRPTELIRPRPPELTINDIIITADNSTGQTEPVKPRVPSGFGDLSKEEVDKIQRIVDQVNLPIDVTGSAAKGERRDAGDPNLPLGKGPGTKSDIDYRVTPEAAAAWNSPVASQLPEMDAIRIRVYNPLEGPRIRFAPGRAPVYDDGLPPLQGWSGGGPPLTAPNTLGLGNVGNGGSVQSSVAGRLIGSVDGLTTAEKSFVGEIVSGGKTVQVIPRSAGRTADFLIDGTKYELKTMTNVVNQTSDGLSSAISTTAMDARAQSGNIIIDARGQAGMTPEIAQRGINRAFSADSKTGAKIGSITIITPEGTVYVPRTPGAKP